MTILGVLVMGTPPTCLDRYPESAGHHDCFTVQNAMILGTV